MDNKPANQNQNNVMIKILMIMRYGDLPFGDNETKRRNGGEQAPSLSRGDGR